MITLKRCSSNAAEEGLHSLNDVAAAAHIQYNTKWTARLLLVLLELLFKK